MEKFETITLLKKDIKDFAKERNLLLDKSKSEWVFFLDSDEKISKFNLSKDNIYSCYKFIRRNYFLKQYVGRDLIIRLVKKGTGKWVREVHEYWRPNVEANVGFIKTPIIHNTADNLTDYISKINNYSKLHAQANKKEGKKSGLFKIIVYPLGKFFVTLIKSRNVVFSIMQAFHSFLSWSNLYFLRS